MPAKNPRLNLTLEPELFDLIDELAALRQVSRASVVVDFLEAAQPAMRNSVTHLRAFMAAQKDTDERFISSLEDAEKVLGPIVAAALDQLELSGLEGGQPPLSNTGVTSNISSSSECRSRAPKPSGHKGSRAKQGGTSHGGQHGGSGL